MKTTGCQIRPAEERPSPVNAGRSPARTSEDLPQPEPPMMVMTRFSASRLANSWTCRSRPKKRSRSAASNGRRPGKGLGNAGIYRRGGVDPALVTPSRRWTRGRRLQFGDRVEKALEAPLRIIGETFRPRWLAVRRLAESCFRPVLDDELRALVIGLHDQPRAYDNAR